MPSPHHVTTQPPSCQECARLLNDTAVVLWEYNAARDILAQTARVDAAYAARWTDLRNASERLDEAHRLEYAHQNSHHCLDLVAKRRPDRRVSGVSDRRGSARGGRRATDPGWASAPPVVACAECPAGTAGLLKLSEGGGTKTAVYRCRDCGYQFERIAEP